MPIGLGIGISGSLRPLKGGAALSGAAALLGAETSGFAVDWTDNSSILKRAGVIIAQGTANGQLTVVGTLTPNALGASFSATNNAYLDMSGFSDLATYRLTNTIYGEVSVDAIDAAIKSGVSFSDSVTGNNISIRFLNASNSTNFIVNSASVISANISPASTPVANTYYKMAGGAQLDNYDVAWAGVAGTHDSAGAMPINPIRCYFGVAFGNNTPLNGKIKRAMILPRKMTLAELQTKTT